MYDGLLIIYDHLHNHVTMKHFMTPKGTVSLIILLSAPHWYHTLSLGTT